MSGYNTNVYREQGTGKLVVNGESNIAVMADSPPVLATVYTKVNAIINLLTAAGINPSS